MRKAGIICLVVLVALGALGASYGAWTQNLNMSATAVSISSLSVTTNGADGLSAAGAVLHGNLNGLGGYSPVAVSFDWGTSDSYGNSPGSISPASTNKSTTGAFTATLSGLDPSTAYHFRTRATGYFTKLGADQQFTTQALPLVVTTDSVDLSPNEKVFTLTGSLDSLGTATRVNVYGKWGMSSVPADWTPTWTAGYPSSRSTTGAFTVTFYNGNKWPSGTYHFRVRGIGNKGAGTAYGNDITYHIP